MSEKLTLKQKLFIEAYLRTRNGVRSAKEAGYQGNYDTLKQVAAENLAKHYIIKEIENRVKPQIMSANQVLAKLTEIASAEWKEFVQIKYNENGDTVSAILPLKDQLKALELLGKYHALYTEKLIVSELDREFEEQLAKLIAGAETDCPIEVESERLN